MKRLITGMLAVCLIIACGCTDEGQKPIIYIVDGAYNLTPQEYIDLMNQTLENQNDSDYLTIPNWDEAVANSVYLTLSVSISFKVNDNGKITRISYHWKITDEESAKTAYFLVYATIGAISAQDSDNVSECLDMHKTGKRSYENDCEVGGSHFSYMCGDYGRHNWFSVDIVDIENPRS